MKRICAALLAVLLAFSCLAVTAFANGAEGDRMYGDVNGDGKINLRDVILVIRVSLEYDEKIDREMADVNLDEKIDMKDILLLMKEVIGGRDLRLGMHFYNSSTVYDAVIDSVVTIYIYDGAGRELGLGSGFIYTSDGLCITCLHVVAGASRIEVVLNDGTRYDAEYVSGYSAELDMAAVKINASGLKPLEISDRSPQSDEKVWAFGSPDGVAGTMTEALAQGYTWTAGGFGKNAGYLMLDVPMIPGNSGGPVIDMNGRVVGVVSMTGIAMSVAWDTEQLYSENLGAEISISDFAAQTEDYASSRYLDETDEDYIPKNNVVYGASLDGLLDTDTFRFRVTEGSMGAITYSIPAGSRNSIAAAVTGLPEETEWQSNYNADLYAWDDGVTSRIISWVKDSGGIATASWHINVPTSMSDYTEGGTLAWDKTTYSEKTDFVTANCMVEGTKEHEYFLRAVDNLAAELKKVADADVPLLFRPFHEAEGNGGADGSGAWFWWSKEGADVYVQLYQYLHNLLTNEYGLHNLIWEFNSYTYSDDSALFYPGADYVDIIGYDKYNATNWSTHTTSPNESAISSTFYGLIKLYNNTKMIAMMENDTIPSAARSTHLRAATP